MGVLSAASQRIGRGQDGHVGLGVRVRVNHSWRKGAIPTSAMLWRRGFSNWAASTSCRRGCPKALIDNAHRDAPVVRGQQEVVVDHAVAHQPGLAPRLSTTAARTCFTARAGRASAVGQFRNGATHTRARAATLRVVPSTTAPGCE